MQEQWGSDLEMVIRVLQTAMAPAFLLAAVASILGVLTNRLARAVDRSRELQGRYRAAAAAERIFIRQELELLVRRKRLVRRAMIFNVSGAVTICIMAGLLFVMGLTSYSQAEVIIALFAVAMGLIALGLGTMLRETTIAVDESDVAFDRLDAQEDGAGDAGPVTPAPAPVAAGDAVAGGD
jgi:hypothetical protein